MTDLEIRALVREGVAGMETRVGRALRQCWCDPKGLTGHGQQPVT